MKKDIVHEKKKKKEIEKNELNKTEKNMQFNNNDITFINESFPNNILFSKLSDEQIKIVQVPLNLNLCIIACPGSGKTSTLTARIIRSIIEKKKSVVCITFTNYAANDLKDKIMKKINCLIDLCSNNDLYCKLFNKKNIKKKCDTNNKMNKSKFKVLHTVLFIGTIHSFCRYILLKYKCHFKILTDSINSNIIKLAFNNFYSSSHVKNNIKTENVEKNNNSSDLLNFFNGMKNFNINEENELEEEEEEEDEEFYNYIYDLKETNEKDYFQQTNIKSILKRKNIIFLKKKIKLMKYVELYNIKIDINEVEKRFYEEYKKILKSAKFIYYDFDDLLIETYKLMKNDVHIRNKILEEWSYVFCDEFQDINTTQFNILQFFANTNVIPHNIENNINITDFIEKNDLNNLNPNGIYVDKHFNHLLKNNNSIEEEKGNNSSLFKGNSDVTSENEENDYKKNKSFNNSDRSITVIGDDDQSIYAFRGAHVNIFNKFLKECNCLLFKLGNNFRSTKEIVRISSNLIMHNSSFRIQKNLHTNNIEGQKVNFHVFKNNIDQISYILSEIVFLKKKYNYQFGDFVILSRTNKTLKDTLRIINNYDTKKRALKFFSEIYKYEKENLKDNNLSEKNTCDTKDSNGNINEKNISDKNNINNEKDKWNDINMETFKIPVKELNKKKSFFGSKEIIELITILRFLLNVDDDIIFKKSFKIIKNDKNVKLIIDKLTNCDFNEKFNNEIINLTDDSKIIKGNTSLFRRIENITRLYILSKKNNLDKKKLLFLNMFTEKELKNIVDFFFCINYFLKFCSGANSVYNLVIEILKKSNFIRRILKKIEKMQNYNNDTYLNKTEISKIVISGEHNDEITTTNRSHKKEENYDETNKNNYYASNNNDKNCKNIDNTYNDYDTMNKKCSDSHVSSNAISHFNEKNEDMLNSNEIVNTKCEQVITIKKRKFDEFNKKLENIKDDEEKTNNIENENLFDTNIVNELKIKNDLKVLFNLSEDELNHNEIQNIFIFLQMTMDYNPNLLQQKCSDCLVCFLNDFKNNIHENMLIEKVTLTTIHKAKGLEWKIVFIINVIEGEIPQNVENNQDIIEERKILYVGITRAKYLLYLLCYLQNNYTSEKNTVSRFINQMKI
ncbi:ATP-dependent DNA helicase UvrD, putative [Plasmodium gallinaceum]|uniref:DNA 3'-5' helicase n=1 Tax=Plasmodium gallinaceum TaxID=5849 RepID=A0A1J1H3J3_PLAGA|nr:ATP-dependent DNA helicase UvrD, putative [Plasmodium gallinaceum]CRG97920.1 ATP-dependent DNA helicase UvrD, putative [Plasmodium gallinaceum]